MNIFCTSFSFFGTAALAEDSPHAAQELLDRRMKIEVDDSFKFHCKQCGRCCLQGQDILLTPRDIYNIPRELELTPGKMCEEYCEVYIEPDSRVPVVRLKPHGSIKRCPLLKDRKCSVHRIKPAVCALFPKTARIQYPLDRHIPPKL